MIDREIRPSKEERTKAAYKLCISLKTLEDRVYRRGMTWEKAMTTKRMNGGISSRKKHPTFGNSFIINPNKPQKVQR